MDFDLFELDEDDDVFQSVLVEPSQKLSEPFLETEFLPKFQCMGEDSIVDKTQFSEEGFVKNKFTSTLNVTHNIADNINLTPYIFCSKHFSARSVSQYIFGEAFINVQNLVVGVQTPLGNVRENLVTNYQRRQHVTQTLFLLLYTTHSDQWPLLCHDVDKLRNLLNSISSKEIWKSIYFANSSKGNESHVPAYHLLHGLLEWKLLDLCILYKFDIATSNLNYDGQKRSPTNFKTQLMRIFDDLLICSLLLYCKKRSAELLFSTPFPCTCIKEFWLLLQLLLNQWSNANTGLETEYLKFWILFNESMSRLKPKIEQFSVSNVGYHEFATWMVQALTKLHGYRSNGNFEGPNSSRATVESAENYEFIEQCTQNFLHSNPNEEQLRVHICLITPILLEWWRPRATVIMSLWEHFHKRLNSSFYATGASPSNLAVVCGSGRTYLERYRTLLAKSANTTPDANLSSYTLFILLLGKCLARLSKSHASGNQSQKLLGRIFSKFCLQKFLALNETGIHHLVELFLVLALCGDLEELIPKLREKLLAISFDKIPIQRQIAVVKGHMALLILCAEHRLELNEYVTKLLQQLNSVRNDTAVGKIVADALLDIFQYYDSHMPRGEHLLIDAWLPSLLQNCTPIEQERTLEALHLIFQKVDNTSNNNLQQNLMIKAMQTHVLSFVKQQYTTSFSEWLPQLAADFCLNAPPTSFPKLLSFFVDTQTASRQALPRFLLKILANESHAKHVEETILMHVWLKSLVLLTPQHAVVVELTTHVVQLQAFRQMTNLTSLEMQQAKEPLCVFIAAVGKVYNVANYKQRCQIADQFNAYVRNFDKWLQSGTDTKLEQQPELLFRFYSFLAIVIYNCSQIVYVKSNNNCFFHVSITRFVLPSSLLTGKPPEGKLTQLVHKIWPVLVQGIGRLNFKTDAYIQKTLNDLIQKWTPLFKTISQNPKIVARPFTTCLLGDNQALSLHICERLTTLFLATQRRQAEPHACLVISIFQEIVTSLTQDSDEMAAQRMETFMKGTCLLTLEHILLVDSIVPSRGMLIDLLRTIISCRTFQNSSCLQDLFTEHLRLITKKHLAYYTFYYFELLMKIAQISCELINKIMDFLLDEIKIVEQKRGGGEDNRIRSCLQQLKQCLENEKRKN